MHPADLEARARAWIADDPDPQTRAAGEALLQAGDAAALAAHFGDRLRFGTAGLRGALGPGPNRMNRANVRRVSAGLADYVLATVPDAAARGAVIGFDARHLSDVFAEDTARVMAGRGLQVQLFDGCVPTPVLAHAVLAAGAACGVMVTASHNPPSDNGYKVYWANGAQIIPPHDRGISEAIDRVGAVAELALPSLLALRAAGRLTAVPASTGTAYLEGVAALRLHRPKAPLRIVYTPLHGVGLPLLETVLRSAGYQDLLIVPEQAAPDPDFPTVRFPNPEEPGAMDLALALAAREQADLVIANDPDADRLAVAVPRPDGSYRSLTGDQVGTLLGWDLLAHPRPGIERPLVATTIVSSSLLGRIAAAHGAAYRETLTGFKWIADRAIAHEAAGGTFLMGYEEALGYTVGSLVRDKDGLSAALLICDLAAWCRDQGRDLLDLLASLYREHGLHLTRQRSVALPGTAGAQRIATLMAQLRADPPRAIAGVEVVRVRDMLWGEGQGSGELPSSDVLAFDLADGGRVLARPSGTEPKIKFYFEVVDRLDAGEALEIAEARALDRLEALARGFEGACVR